MNKQTCCFTGHRPQSLPWKFNEHDLCCQLLKYRLKAEIRHMITQRGVRHFISGMALGVDTWAAEIVLELKQTYPITLECAIPCETQAARWTEDDRERWFSIVERCDKETMLQTRYTADCMQKRNRYMIDHSDYVIAVWNGKPSGTGSTVTYAKERGREIVVIAP